MRLPERRVVARNLLYELKQVDLLSQDAQGIRAGEDERLIESRVQLHLDFIRGYNCELSWIFSEMLHLLSRMQR